MAAPEPTARPRLLVCCTPGPSRLHRARQPRAAPALELARRCTATCRPACRLPAALPPRWAMVHQRSQTQHGARSAVPRLQQPWPLSSPCTRRRPAAAGWRPPPRQGWCVTTSSDRTRTLWTSVSNGRRWPCSWCAPRPRWQSACQLAAPTRRPLPARSCCTPPAARSARRACSAARRPARSRSRRPWGCQVMCRGGRVAAASGWTLTTHTAGQQVRAHTLAAMLLVA